MSDRNENTIVVLFCVVILGGIAALCWIWPSYNVWVKAKGGEAILAEAEFSRRARVAEAQAKADAAKLEAQAMITRAEGQAKANEEIAKTLTPSVLQYQYLEMLQEQGANGDRTVVYIPTNPATGMPASLPATEAPRIGK